MNALEHLKLVKDEPDVYRFISDEALADLLLQLVETKSLFKKAKVQIKQGKDGKTPKAGVDYLSRKQQEKMISRLVSELPTIKGKDAEVSNEEIDNIADRVYDALFPQLPVALTSEELRDRLELLTGKDRLEISAINGLEERLQKTKKGGTTALIARYLNQIGDVNVKGANNGQSLVYDAVTKTWTPQTITGSGGGGGTWGSIIGTLSDQTDLQNALDAKANTSHTHTESDITDLDKYTQAQVDALLHSPVTVSDTAEIDLILSGQHISANLKSGSIDVLRLDAGVQYSLGLADSAIQSGDLATVATSGDYNDLSNLPDLSIYDSFDQYADLASFPATGDADVVYVAQDTGYLYRWTGSTYAQMSVELALGETASTAYRGDRGKTAFDHTSLTNNPHNVTKTQVGLSNVPNTDATARSSHTGTQTASTISDFDTQVESNINTLAKLNAIIADATLIDTTDSRLSDARTPTAHTHTESDISDLGNYLENLIEDLTPQLGADLECEDHDITNVSRITSSSTTSYTGKEDLEGTFQQTGSVNITGGDGFAPPFGLGGAVARSTVLANKTLNFTNGTEYFGSGFLFWNKSKIQSQAGSYFGGMYALASQPVFDLQGTHSPVMPFNYEILSSPTYIVSGTGALTILDVANLSAKQTFGADVNVTRYFGIDLGLPTGTANGVRGTLTNYIGYKTPNFDQVETAGNSVLRPTNGTHVLLGTSTPPSGYWNIYQADANVLPNRWNAAHQYGYKSISSATTIDGTYDRIELTGTSTYTITLPTAVGIAGREYTFVKSGASGTITIDGNGSETINGTTTKTLTTQYDVLTIISNGSNWLIID